MTQDVIWLQRLHFERPVEEGIKEYDFHAGDDNVEEDQGSEVKESVAGEAVESDASALYVGDDDEKSDDLDRMASASTKGLAESAKEVHWAHPVATKAKLSSKVGQKVTKSGHVVDPRKRLIESLEATAVDLRYLSSMAELDNLEVLMIDLTGENLELNLMGAGIGGRFKNTNKLKVMNFKQAMKSLADNKWVEEVANEKSKFIFIYPFSKNKSLPNQNFWIAGLMLVIAFVNLLISTK